MENSTITNPETPSAVKYAGFWWRFLAYLIDGVILGTVTWIIYIPLFAVFGLSLYSMSESGMDLDDNPAVLGSMILVYIFIVGISIVIQWLYFSVLESSKMQGTVGKMALRIKVTDYDGNRISFARATGRHFGKYLSSLIFLIGYIMAGFTAKKQALHDILANCYVIKE
ncbi:MAG: RDD family protein [Bacteroidetes bacterium]|nr:RDD family protein [Bacteroidota bacterium]